MTTQATRKDALRRLDAFVGEWRLGIGNAIPRSDDGGARSVFEWMFDGQFLVQRTEIPDPNAPNGFCIVAYHPGTDGYAQHYFDSRGVVRLYGMTFQDGVWTLLREKPAWTACTDPWNSPVGRLRRSLRWVEPDQSRQETQSRS